MSMTTFIVRNSTGKIIGDRTSGTMHYTHALVTKDETGAYSWHTTEALAHSAASATYAAKQGVKVRPVEAHKGGKAAVLKRLAKADEAMVEAATSPESMRAASKAIKAATTGEKAAPATSSRSVPTEAANAERQAYVAEVGIDKYRNQYNGGWDAATAGGGAKNAASGKASVAWMDGYLDRTANPGKAGIAAKWSALRSTDAPVAKVDAPAPAEAPAEKAEKAPAKPAKAPAKAKSTKAAKKA